MAITTYQGTLRDLLSRMDTWLGDREHKVYDQISRQEAITDALHHIHSQLAVVGPEMLTKTATVSWVDGTIEYALPNDFFRPLRLYIDQGDTVFTTIPVMRSESLGTGLEGWYIRNENIGIYFASAPSGTVKLDYVYLPAFPTDVTDAVEGVPDNWISVIVKYACFALTREPRMMQKLEMLYTNELKFLLAQAATRSYDATMSAARDNGVDL